MIDENELMDMIKELETIGVRLTEKEIAEAKKGKLCLKLRYINCLRNCLGRV